MNMIIITTPFKMFMKNIYCLLLMMYRSVANELFQPCIESHLSMLILTAVTNGAYFVQIVAMINISVYTNYYIIKD